MDAAVEEEAALVGGVFAPSDGRVGVLVVGLGWVGGVGARVGLLGFEVLAALDEGLSTAAEGQLLAEALYLIGGMLPGGEVAEVLSYAPGQAFRSDFRAVPFQ